MAHRETDQITAKEGEQAKKITELNIHLQEKVFRLENLQRDIERTRENI